jgi:hypothetical protein
MTISVDDRRDIEGEEAPMSRQEITQGGLVKMTFRLPEEVQVSTTSLGVVS